MGDVGEILFEELMLGVPVRIPAALFAIANGEIFVSKGFEQFFEPVRINGIAMGADIDDEFATCGFYTIIQRTPKGEFIGRDMDNLRSITFCNSNGVIGRAGINKDNFNILNRTNPPFS